jgi:hypothetical protein
MEDRDRGPEDTAPPLSSTTRHGLHSLQSAVGRATTTSQPIYAIYGINTGQRPIRASIHDDLWPIHDGS